jgi:mono/diheme cytochrome c family protein
MLCGGILLLSGTIIFLNPMFTSADNATELVKKGEHLVSLGNCNLCHTPKNMDKSGMVLDISRSLSGHPEGSPEIEHTSSVSDADGHEIKSNFHLTSWDGPWGISYAANLTPDEETGIGLWDDDMFISTIRNGKHMGSGREIKFPMPWKSLSELKDDELQAIFAYLKSVNPINNKVPNPILPGNK